MGNVLLYAVPVFFFSILLEFVYLQRVRRESVDYRDAGASILMGVGNLLLSVLFAFVNLTIYQFFYDHRILTIPATAGFYVLFIFLEDYAYYWFHRISHVTRLWWSSHETHHSSDQYNLSTAVRQTWTGIPITWCFWAPLCWLGFPPSWIIAQQSISLFYQFWIHTRAVKSLGFLELFMNTPSHHRVHHAKDLQYLDANYAGIFIIWDKLHKTFVPETVEPNYGVLSGFRSTNPFRIGFHMWWELARDLWRAPGFLNRLRILFYPPGWSVEHGWSKTTRALKQD